MMPDEKENLRGANLPNIEKMIQVFAAPLTRRIDLDLYLGVGPNQEPLPESVITCQQAIDCGAVGCLAWYIVAELGDPNRSFGTSGGDYSLGVRDYARELLGLFFIPGNVPRPDPSSGKITLFSAGLGADRTEEDDRLEALRRLKWLRVRVIEAKS